MSKVYFTSDQHFGHRNILKYRLGFDNIQQHDECLLDNYQSIIHPRDIIYFLGDVCFDKKYLSTLKKLPGHKHLILGNHDTEYLHINDFTEIFEKIHGLKKYKKFWLSHAPIHSDELRDKINIHGHTHSRNIDDPHYFNACVDVNNYKPVNFELIKTYF